MSKNGLRGPRAPEVYGDFEHKKKRDPANPDGMAGYCIKWDSEYHEKIYDWGWC